VMYLCRFLQCPVCLGTTGESEKLFSHRIVGVIAAGCGYKRGEPKVGRERKGVINDSVSMEHAVEAKERLGEGKFSPLLKRGTTSHVLLRSTLIKH
jgi:hypothetical protein